MRELPDGIDVSALDDACYEYHREYVTDWDADHLAPRVAAIREALGLGDAQPVAPAAVTPEPAGPREPGQPRVFRPDSVEPMDITLLDAPNGLRFCADPADQTAARWRALPEFGGDGGYYSWWLLNDSDGRAYTLTEVPAVPSAEPGAGA